MRPPGDARGRPDRSRLTNSQAILSRRAPKYQVGPGWTTSAKRPRTGRRQEAGGRVDHRVGGRWWPYWLLGEGFGLSGEPRLRGLKPGRGGGGRANWGSGGGAPEFDQDASPCPGMGQGGPEDSDEFEAQSIQRGGFAGHQRAAN